jgi:adenine phosphoribosyltransferase
MNFAEEVRQRVSLVPGAGGRKRHLLHPFNGRFHPVDHAALEALVQAIAPRIDLARVDYVLGFPEGGSIPAYAFARAVDRPVVLASRLSLDRPDTITFEQPHAGLGTTQYLYGLSPGDRVMIFEDELTTGHTAVNAARALRGAGVEIDQIASLFVVDHPALWNRLQSERLALTAGVRLPPEYAPRPLDGETG